MTEEKYISPEDDGLPTRSSGSWARAKLFYLSGYVDILLEGMKNQDFRGFNYIDLFAGPGKNHLRENDEVVLGSPLLAITNDRSFSAYHFVEHDHDRMDALRTRVRASGLAELVSFYPQDAALAVETIVERIKAIDAEYLRGQLSCLNFAFIDPDGLQATWEIIEKLTEPFTMDLLIHYPEGTLNRNMRNSFEVENSAVDRFFGTREWRDVFGKYAAMDRTGAAHRELIDLYRGKLETRGYKDIRTPEPLVRSGATEAPLYRLIFASKNPRGADFWAKIAQRDPGGQIGFKWE